MVEPRRFSVWAPQRTRVEMVLDGELRPMERGRGGWWFAFADAAAGGCRYGFRLDGGAALPDPRSPSQPEGVEGLSALVDHGAFEWTDRRWRGFSLRGAVLYELHVGTFSPEGTFDGVIDRLPHLLALGVDAIELLPVAEYSGARGWGYDGVDLFAPHHAYGGPEGLKRLVDACHHHGLGVILDVVYNHLGPAGNHLAEFGPYYSEVHRTNWGWGLNFDGPGSDEVRRFVIDNARMWFTDYHVDGLRLDAVHAIVDESACHLLEQLAVEIDALTAHLRRPLLLIAESDRNDPRLVRSRDGGGYGLNAVWSDEWHHALHAALTGERDGYYEDFGTVVELAKALRQAWVYDGTYSPHRQRHHGRLPTGLSGHQLVVSTQNHDQVGNRAAGERSAALMSDGRLRVAAALLLTGPFTPMLFQGEEWGASAPFLYFTDHHDVDLGRSVSEGRRREFARFGWEPGRVPDPQDPTTFRRSVLDWSELGREPHAGLLRWYRELIRLRRSHPALSDPRLDTVGVDAEVGTQTVAVDRPPFRVLVNVGAEQHRFALPAAGLMATSDPRVAIVAGEAVLPADSAAVVELDAERREWR